MPIDMNIGMMNPKFDTAIDTMAKISALAHSQAMAPYQFQQAALANQRAQQANQQISQMSPLQLQQATLANQRAQQVNQQMSKMSPLQLQAMQQQVAQRQAMNPLQVKAMQLENQKRQMLAQNPLLGLSGTAGQIGAASYAQQHPELFGSQGQPQQQPNGQQPTASGIPQTAASGAAQNILQGVQSAQDLQQAKSKFYSQRVSGASWFNMPKDYKNQQLAYAQAMGYSPSEAGNLFLQGKSIEDLAKDKGLNWRSIDPSQSYAPTQTTRTRTQLQAQSLNELNTLSSNITPALAPYSRKIDGLSPALIKQELAGQNEDSQAKYLAARALQPEISATRIKAFGGTVGEKALQEIQNKSVGRLGSMQSLVSPKVFSQAQNYVDQWINQATTGGVKQALSSRTSKSTVPDISRSGSPDAGATKLSQFFK